MRETQKVNKEIYEEVVELQALVKAKSILTWVLSLHFKRVQNDKKR